MPSLRILLADDHTVVRQGLKKVLEDHEGWQVVAEAADGREAVKHALAVEPDVAVLDIGMPLLNGIEATRQIIRRLPDLGVRRRAADLRPGPHRLGQPRRQTPGDHAAAAGPGTLRGLVRAAPWRRHGGHGRGRPVDDAARPAAQGADLRGVGHVVLREGGGRPDRVQDGWGTTTPSPAASLG